MERDQQLKKLGEQIKLLRRRKRMTQSELADATGLGFKKSYISYIETAYAQDGRPAVVPKDSILQAIAEALGVNVSQFHAILGRVDTPEPLPVKYELDEEMEELIESYTGAPPEVKKAAKDQMKALFQLMEHRETTVGKRAE